MTMYGIDLQDKFIVYIFWDELYLLCVVVAIVGNSLYLRLHYIKKQGEGGGLNEWYVVVF